MAIRKNVLRMCMEQYPNWITVPDRFLILMYLVNYGQYMDRDKGMEIEQWQCDTLSGEVINLGKYLSKLLRVNFSPFRDFMDYEQHHVPQEDVGALFKEITLKEKERHDLLVMLYDSGTMPNEDTVKLEVIVTEISDQVINGLRPNVDFD